MIIIKNIFFFEKKILLLDINLEFTYKLFRMKLVILYFILIKLNFLKFYNYKLIYLHHLILF